MALNITLGGGNGFLYGETIEHQSPTLLFALAWTIAYYAFLGIITLLAHICSLDEWNDGEIEMTGKGIVA